ncbi:hypothetical protein B0O99DRAFT_215494 [Bisporella sp. PMI_857]|nr:hypothetical protein B0O99DRAFT_215494 [Bisporella sp. PMI_857]
MGPPPPGMDPAGLLEFIDISDDEPSIIHTPHNRPAVPPQPASSPIRAIPKRMMRPLNAGPSARGRDNHMSKQSKLQNEYEALEDWNEDGDFIQQASQNVGNFTPSQGSLQRQIAKMEHVNNESNAHNFGDPADETDEQDDARREQCIDAVVECLPDICRDFVYGLYHTISKDQNFLVAHILDQPDYPRAQDVQNALKRKRNPGLIDSEDDEEILHKYEAKGRVAGPQAYIRKILGSEFPQIPMKYIDACLKTSGGTLFSAYRVLEEADRTFDPNKPTYIRIKSRKIATDEFLDDNLDNLIAKSPLEEQEVLRELQVSRRVRWKADEKREEERLHILAEEANCVRAQAEGAMRDCGCCFGDYPLNRMVHCDNDEELHFFCRDCAQRNAETEIGNSRYELKCMDTSGCVAGFSMEQRSLFLDAKTTIALERIHQETELRMAGIENLASCPFCTYAAEYPPVEVNTEFRCQKPDCKKVSCRLCNLESHVPKSCEENAKENGLSVRRQIEEAMSEALIRRCNKCQTPFVKTDGCNKISCTAKGCGNVQCYICSANCTGPNGYSHFNDPHRGGKPTNCPLFDQKGVEVRHSDEVEKAQQKARAKVLAEHPDVTQEDLDIKLSEKVREDEEKRKAAAPHLGFRPLPPFVMAPRPQA